MGMLKNIMIEAEDAIRAVYRKQEAGVISDGKIVELKYSIKDALMLALVQHNELPVLSYLFIKDARVADVDPTDYRVAAEHAFELTEEIEQLSELACEC